jgi:hypothetical protein
MFSIGYASIVRRTIIPTGRSELVNTLKKHKVSSKKTCVAPSSAGAKLGAANLQIYAARNISKAQSIYYQPFSAIPNCRN